MSLITSHPSHHFDSKARVVWNTALKLIVGKNDTDFSLKIGQFKDKLKSHLLATQNLFDEIEWYSENFQFRRLDPL